MMLLLFSLQQRHLFCLNGLNRQISILNNWQNIFCPSPADKISDLNFKVEVVKIVPTDSAAWKFWSFNQIYLNNIYIFSNWFWLVLRNIDWKSISLLVEQIGLVPVSSSLLCLSVKGPQGMSVLLQGAVEPRRVVLLGAESHRPINNKLLWLPAHSTALHCSLIFSPQHNTRPGH